MHILIFNLYNSENKIKQKFSERNGSNFCSKTYLVTCVTLLLLLSNIQLIKCNKSSTRSTNNKIFVSYFSFAISSCQHQGRWYVLFSSNTTSSQFYYLIFFPHVVRTQLTYRPVENVSQVRVDCLQELESSTKLVIQSEIPFFVLETLLD